MKPVAVTVVVLALLLAVGSCATRQRTRVPAQGGSPTAEAPIRPAYNVPVPLACSDRRPPPAAEGLAGAMVRVAAAEWRKWGERVVEIQPGRAVMELPDAMPTVWEQEADAFPMLADYWCATPPFRNYWEVAARHAGTGAIRRPDGSIDRYVLEQMPVGDTPFAAAWSAAFVSYVVFMGGVPDSRFRYSDTHWDYVADTITAPAGSRAFRAAGINEVPPRPGDLVCATRSGGPPADWHRLPAEGTRPMHCDIVVGPASCGYSASGRCIEAIGGNVLQGVTLSRIPVDTLGRVIPGGEERAWVVVLQNMGR